MDWTGGYVSDIGYTAGFYRETASSHMAFAALSIGRSPGRALKPKRYLEIGFGQGFGLTLLAAANPDCVFEGYDFNPEHVAHARRLIEDAELTNVTVSESSFEEAAAEAGANDVDVIAIHGIFSWVSRAAQDAIVAITRQRLQPDGLLYVSYNCMPGWAPLAPIRQFMLQVKRRNAGASQRQLALALDLIGQLKTAGALYFQANPSAAQHLDHMVGLDRVYLAHEYLDEQWDLFQFSEVVERFGPAKLGFVASATLPENLDNYAVPPAMAALVADTPDPILRETMRDYASNKRFRRDIFARGGTALSEAEQRRQLAGLRFALTLPRGRVTYKFAGPLMELNAKPEFYDPLLARLAAGIATFEELLALPPFAGGKLASLLDCLVLLVHSGQVLPLVAPADPEPARRFNRTIVGHAVAARFYGALASPVARTGVPVRDLDLLALSAVEAGRDDAPSVARHVLQGLNAIGRHPMRDGVLLRDEPEALAFLEEEFTTTLAESLPVWRNLGLA